MNSTSTQTFAELFPSNTKHTVSVSLISMKHSALKNRQVPGW